ncbi:sterol desaturase family protein [Leclercia pneumoniae]|uniref:sterol desaturase family protein n=1 Tax=Leclercia pneumoniae TaxID=2815358 RepID=UPI0030D37FFD
MSDLLIPIIVMLVLVFGEAGILHLTGRQKIDWHDVVFNINSGHIVLWLFRCTEVLCYGLVFGRFSLHLFDGVSPVWVWLFTLLAWDFGFYWLHRLHHMLRPLWAVHVVHHQGEHFNLSLGVRNSWYSSLTGIPFFMVLAVLGVPLSVFLVVSVLHYSVQFFNHNALTPRLGWLEYLFVTPSHHRVHHYKARRFADSNYGGTFIFWDKLFGTFCRVTPPVEPGYGVQGERPSSNPLRESNLPFLRMVGVRKTRAQPPRRFNASATIVIAGALLLFGLVLGYIQLYGYDIERVTTQQTALFLLLAAGSIALGGISDGQRWGVVLWLLVTLGLPLLFIGIWDWRQPYWLGVMAGLVVHALALLAGQGRRVNEAQREPV